ncbi:hypothetical protein [Thermoplasma volcanium]|uniref:hypothetical protein n=1 Tax=Thermoplasma volcanium TaxID=50339 RepID=UPI0012EA3F4E|nr:hypothetical protein [Thermoplasma volcanium]
MAKMIDSIEDSSISQESEGFYNIITEYRSEIEAILELVGVAKKKRSIRYDQGHYGT